MEISHYYLSVVINLIRPTVYIQKVKDMMCQHDLSQFALILECMQWEYDQKWDDKSKTNKNAKSHN